MQRNKVPTCVTHQDKLFQSSLLHMIWKIYQTWHFPSPRWSWWSWFSKKYAGSPQRLLQSWGLHVSQANWTLKSLTCCFGVRRQTRHCNHHLWALCQFVYKRTISHLDKKIHMHMRVHVRQTTEIEQTFPPTDNYFSPIEALFHGMLPRGTIPVIAQ